MATSIRTRRVNHINVVVEDFDASLAHFQKLFGAEFLLDMPSRDWHACLIGIGRVIFELFAPHDFLLNSRYGPHYVGIEYEADLADAREVSAAHGVRVIRDVGKAFHGHPADAFGCSFEFFGEGFHERKWELTGGKLMQPAEYWLDEHPLGLTGLKAYSHVVADIEAATRFMQSYVSAEVLYEAARPSVGARVVALKVDDTVLELLTPTGEGVIQQHLRRFGDGIRSTIFGVRSLDQARRYFAERGVQLVPGDADNVWAVPAEQNRGIIFEFAE